AEEKKAEEKKAEEEKNSEEKGGRAKISSVPGGRHHAKADSKQVAKDLELMKTPADKGAPPPPPPSPKRKESGPKAGGDALDELWGKAVGGKDLAGPKSEGSSAASRERSAPAPGDENLPEQLKPSDIQRGMAGIKGKVQNCYAQYNVPGMVNVTVTINP